MTRCEASSHHWVFHDNRFLLTSISNFSRQHFFTTCRLAFFTTHGFSRHLVPSFSRHSVAHDILCIVPFWKLDVPMGLTSSLGGSPCIVCMHGPTLTNSYCKMFGHLFWCNCVSFLIIIDLLLALKHFRNSGRSTNWTTKCIRRVVLSEIAKNCMWHYTYYTYCFSGVQLYRNINIPFLDFSKKKKKPRKARKQFCTLEWSRKLYCFKMLASGQLPRTKLVTSVY